MDSQEKKNQGVPRSVSLLAGFLIVILIGAFVVKKMGPKKNKNKNKKIIENNRK